MDKIVNLYLDGASEKVRVIVPDRVLVDQYRNLCSRLLAVVTCPCESCEKLIGEAKAKLQIESELYPHTYADEYDLDGRRGGRCG